MSTLEVTKLYLVTCVDRQLQEYALMINTCLIPSQVMIGCMLAPRNKLAQRQLDEAAGTIS